MPTKSPEDEKKWNKAKQLAAEQGHAENYAYIMGIYKNMKPDHFKNAALRSRLIRLAYENPEARSALLPLLKRTGSAFLGWAADVHGLVGAILHRVKMEGRGHDNNGRVEKPAKTMATRSGQTHNNPDFYEGYIHLWDQDGDKYTLRFTALTDKRMGTYDISLSGNTGMSGQDQVMVKRIPSDTDVRAVWPLLLRAMQKASERNRVQLYGKNKFWVL